MPEYTVIWVKDSILESSGDAQVVGNATNVINSYAGDGWRVVSLVPGTNAQTYSGVYITLTRESA